MGVFQYERLKLPHPLASYSYGTRMPRITVCITNHDHGLYGTVDREEILNSLIKLRAHVLAGDNKVLTSSSRPQSVSFRAVLKLKYWNRLPVPDISTALTEMGLKDATPST
jgi:hypothetical protein